MRSIYGFVFGAVSLFPFSALAAPKAISECKVKIGIAYLDRLGNTNYGVPSASQKDVEKRLAKFGDVCLTTRDAKPDVIFFIHTSPATFHGTRVFTNNSNSSAAAVGADGSAAAASSTTTTTTAVPYSVDYSVFVLDIELPQADDKFTILHTFDQKGLYNTVYGIGYGKGKHPIPNVIEAGAKWLHEEYLTGAGSRKW